jgi:transcription initiation factor IIE alpha subunit
MEDTMKYPTSNVRVICKHRGLPRYTFPKDPVTGVVHLELVCPDCGEVLVKP